MRWQSFAIPRRGYSADEYEDALAADPAGGRFAVADGASEASFAGLWARLLVEGFVHPPKGPGPGANWLAPLRQRWAASVDGLVVPWYAEAKRRQGAFATFLGLVVKRSGSRPEGTWLARAVGDCCLFHTGPDGFRLAFPVRRSAEFGNHPHLLGSRPGSEASERPEQAWGGWRCGDRLWLMTDALAQWFLAQVEGDRRPWEDLASLLETSESLTARIEDLRDSRVLRNDDVTLLAIEP